MLPWTEAGGAEAEHLVGAAVPLPLPAETGRGPEPLAEIRRNHDGSVTVPDMPIARVQVRIPSAANISEDMAINTWHFTCTAIDEGTRNAIQTALVAFYNSMGTYRSSLMSWNTARLRWFNMSDAEPRVPLEDETAGFSSTSSSPTAPELALCVSFNGAFVSGFSQARRRGRVYLGPLAAAAVDSTARVTPTLVSTMATAAGTLLSTSNAASDWAWVVYSPTGNTAYPVVAGWVDNEMDVQRRRGRRATVRTVF